MLKRVLSLVIIASMVMALSVSFPIAVVAEGGLTDDLVLWYQFDETEGTTVKDASGNNNDGRLFGDTSWAEGKIGGSVRLGGNNGYVSMPAGVIKNLDDITISTWVKMEKTDNYQRLFDFGVDTSVNMFITPTGGNEGAIGLAFAITTSGWTNEEHIEKGTSLDTGVWKHVAVVLNGDTGILYEDGVEVARNNSITLNPSDLGNTINNYIGKSQYDDPYFQGNFDDFRIYSKALSADQIKALYENVGPTITSIDDVEVTTVTGKAPELPKTVTAHYSDGTSSSVDVVWDAVDPSLYAKEGTFTVKGTVKGTSIKAVANVTVGKALDLEEGLVLWYKFDDANGTTVTDSSGSEYNGKLNGTPNWVEGVKGSALKFNGTNNYIEVGNGTALQPSKLTVGYWIKRTASMNDGERMVFWAKPDTGWNENGWYLTYNSGKSSIMVVDGFNGFGVNEQPDEFLPLNEWTHVVVTFDSETKEAAIYKNGVPQTVLRGEEANLGGDPSSITATDPSDVKYMGFNGPTWSSAWQNATFDDFRIYNKALTEEEVKALYEEEKGPQIEPTIESIKPVEVTTKAGEKPQLPSTVTAVYSDGTEKDVAVAWDAIDPAQYAKAGTFEVQGTVAGTNIKAKAVVKVIEENDFDVSVKFNINSLAPYKWLEAKVTVRNKTNYAEPALAIVALYDSQGRMVNVSFISKVIPSQGTENLNAGFKLPANVEGYKAKVFVWEGNQLETSSMKPLSNTVILE